MNNPPFDISIAHRWFAVELNNLAWEFVEAAERSPDDSERMVHAAHASCFHWLEAGNLLNHLRGQCLLSSAYGKAGLWDAATRHAEKSLSLSLDAGESQTDFDRACVHGCAASAFSNIGNTKRAREQVQKLQTRFDRLNSEEDKALIQKLYRAQFSDGDNSKPLSSDTTVADASGGA